MLGKSSPGTNKSIARLFILTGLAVILTLGILQKSPLPLALLPQACTPAVDEAKVKGDIEDAVDDFYRALSKSDFDRLKKYCAEDLVKALEGARERGELQAILDRYKDVDLSEVTDIDLSKDEADVEVEIELAGEKTDEKLSVALVDDEWLVSEWHDMPARDERREDEGEGAGEQPGEGIEGLWGRGPAGEESGMTPSEEAEVRRTAEAFVEAMKTIDLEVIKRSLGDPIREQFMPQIERLEGDPDIVAQQRESNKDAEWRIERIFPDPDGDEVVIHLQIRDSPTSEWQEQELREKKGLDGTYKITYLGPRQADEPGREEPADIEAPEPEGEAAPGAETRVRETVDVFLEQMKELNLDRLLDMMADPLLSQFRDYAERLRANPAALDAEKSTWTGLEWRISSIDFQDDERTAVVEVEAKKGDAGWKQIHVVLTSDEAGNYLVSEFREEY